MQNYKLMATAASGDIGLITDVDSATTKKINLNNVSSHSADVTKAQGYTYKAALKAPDSKPLRYSVATTLTLVCLSMIASNMKLLSCLFFKDTLQDASLLTSPDSSLKVAMMDLEASKTNATYMAHQSGGVLRAIQKSTEFDIPFMYVVEFLIAYAQYNILDKVWGRKKNVKDGELFVLYFFIFFCPLQLVRTASQDLGSIRELFLYLSIEQVMVVEPDGMFPVIYQAFIIGVELMVDPMSFILNAGTILTSRKTQQVRLISFAVSSLVTFGLMIAT